MMPQKILIYGAGAIGCVVAARLILAGHQVTVLARGEKKNILQNKGILLKDLTGEYQVHPFRVIDETDQSDAQDYIFISTKFNALAEISNKLSRYLHDGTVIVPLMNGIPFWYFYGLDNQSPIKNIKCLDPDSQLIKQFPLQHLMGAVVFITAQLTAVGQVNSENPYLLIFGEPDHQPSERLNQLIDLFEGSEIEVRPADHIRDQIWTKVMANLSSNPLSVIANAPLNEIYSNPKLIAITKQILQEVRTVAACYAARISIDPATFLKLGAEMGNIYTSMWYDYENGQVLELENIAEAVFELAEVYGCSMPITKHIYDLTLYLSEQSRQSTKRE